MKRSEVTNKDTLKKFRKQIKETEELIPRLKEIEADCQTISRSIYIEVTEYLTNNRIFRAAVMGGVVVLFAEMTKRFSCYPYYNFSKIESNGFDEAAFEFLTEQAGWIHLNNALGDHFNTKENIASFSEEEDHELLKFIENFGDIEESIFRHTELLANLLDCENELDKEFADSFETKLTNSEAA